MTYAAGEAQILQTLQLLPDVTSKNSSRVDWRILNRGKSKQYFIVRPGESLEEIMGMGHSSIHITYQTIIEVWQLYQEATNATDLETYMDTVKAHLRKYRFLGGGSSSTYIDAMVTGTGPMLEKWTSEGGPRFAVQEIRLQWVDQASNTLAE